MGFLSFLIRNVLFFFFWFTLSTLVPRLILVTIILQVSVCVRLFKAVISSLKCYVVISAGKDHAAKRKRKPDTHRQ